MHRGVLLAQDRTSHLPRTYAGGRWIEDLPAEFQRRDDRLRRIREAQAALEKEAAAAGAADLRQRAAAELQRGELAASEPLRKRAARRAAQSERKADQLAPQSEDNEDDPDGGATASLPHHRVPTTPNGEPTDKAQRNFTNPDSRIMVRNGVYLQAYNAQAVVSESRVIVAHAITNQPPDQQHLMPMLERVRDNCGQLPDVLTADTGYLSEDNIAYCESHGVDASIAVGRKEDDGAKLGRLPMTHV